MRQILLCCWKTPEWYPPPNFRWNVQTYRKEEMNTYALHLLSTFSYFCFTHLHVGDTCVPLLFCRVILNIVVDIMTIHNQILPDDHNSVATPLTVRQRQGYCPLNSWSIIRFSTCYQNGFLLLVAAVNPTSHPKIVALVVPSLESPLI